MWVSLTLTVAEALETLACVCVQLTIVSVDTTEDQWLCPPDARPGGDDLPLLARATSRRQRSKFSMKFPPTNQRHCGDLSRRWLAASEKPEAPSPWRQRRRSEGWRGVGTRMAGSSGNKLGERGCFVRMWHACIPRLGTPITLHHNKTNT